MHEPTKALPSDRHTDARSGNVYEEDVKVGAGRLNVLHLKEIYLKRFEARSQGKALGAGELAKEYGIDPRLLEKVRLLIRFVKRRGFVADFLSRSTGLLRGLAELTVATAQYALAWCNH